MADLNCKKEDIFRLRRLSGGTEENVLYADNMIVV